MGVAQNHFIARKWYEKSAAQGHEKSIYNLAILNVLGEGGDVNYARALSLFKQASELKDAKMLGQSEYMIGEMYTRGFAVAADTSMAEKWYEKSQSHGDKQAVVALRQIKKSRKQLADAVKNFNEGTNELRQGYTQLAENNLKIAIRLKPDFIQANSSLGAALGMQGKYSESIEVLKKAISIQPVDADLHANLGYSYSKLGDWDNAIKQYNIALKINPTHKKTLYNLQEANRHVTK